MHSPTPSVAILFFARSAAQEAVCKPLAPVRARNERTWQTLEELTWAKISATRLPAFRSHELIRRQAGDSFGRQLRRAAQAVLELGYQTVLCIGNDCPGLRVADLQAAAQLAQSGNPATLGTLPIGTDKRGGAYLIGLSRAALADADAFERLPWQSGRLAQALTDHLTQQGYSCVQLAATHRDWNHRPDCRLTDLAGEWRWLRILTGLLLPNRQTGQADKLPGMACGRTTPSGLRAPPAV